MCDYRQEKVENFRVREEKRTMVAGREQVRAADGERTTRSDAAADWLLEEARERVFDAHKRAVGAPLALAPNLSQPYISLSEPNTEPHKGVLNLKGSPNNRSSYGSHWGFATKAIKVVVITCEINLVQ